MKKIIFTFLGTLCFTCAGLFIPQITAKAASPWQNSYWSFFCSQGQFGSGCHGYYSNQVSSCFTSSSGLCNGDDVLLGGVNVSNASGFTGLIQGNLFNGGTPKAPSENSCGAAFIINMMLGHGPFGSNCAAGIAAAAGPSNSTFNYWVSLVNSYQNSTDPNYGVTWSTTDNPAINSSWWPDIGDEVFHSNIWHCNDSGTQCGGRWEDTAATGWVNREVDVSIPVVRFYFPGGSFEIEMWCGNLVGSLNPLQIVKQPQPHGSISITCSNPSAGQYDAIVNYGDSNGFPTSGTISSNNGWNPGNVASPSTTPIPTSYANPYSPPPPVVLTVSDNGTQTQYPYSPPPPASCISSPACNLSLVSPPGLIDPYTPFSVTANVTYSPSQAPPTPPIMQLVITNPSGAQAYNSSQNVNGNSPASVTFSISALNNGTGNYAATGTLTSTYFSPIICHTTIPVVDLPYLQVYGGDTMIGGSPTYSSGGSTCATLPTASGPAGIYSWNKDDSPNYSGAGDQYAVQVLGQINGFVSGQNSTNSPTGLSFSNSSVTPNSGLFGGSFFAPPADCDFTSDIASDPNATTYTTNQTIAQNAVMNVSAQSNGAPTIIYVKDANVYIANSITYGNTNWASPSKIPDFELVVVGGNIYVSDNVTELDGLYVAEPDTGRSPQGGAIYTCGNPNYTPVTAASSSYYGSCTNKLTIYGSFVAQQVQFLRTNGTVGQASSDTLSNNHAAEVFDYTPEMWLPRGNSNPNSGYEAITGLPPVL
jgi:hypothetical protein